MWFCLVLVMDLRIHLQDSFIYKEVRITLKKMYTKKLVSIAQPASQNVV